MRGGPSQNQSKQTSPSSWIKYIFLNPLFFDF